MDNKVSLIEAPVVLDAAGIPVIVTPRAVESVVSWFGSIETYPQFDEGEEVVQDVATSLLNKGTLKRDRFALAADLEDRGAEISFGSNGTRVHFSGRALSKDVEHVLQLTVEQLREPLFDPAEFDKAIQRMRASLRRSASSTSYRAGVALRRRLFSKAHPNFSRDPAEDLQMLAACNPDQIHRFHDDHFSGRNAVVCVAGDVSPDAFAAMVERAFGGWDKDTVRGDFESAGRDDADVSRREIEIADRENLDVRIGHAVHLNRNDPDFLPLYVGNYVLGGNFSARLMQKVRNEMGLTYGIGSSLAGFEASYEGMWQISVTLSRDRLEEGLAATLAEIERFLESGATAAELDAKKTTICGSYEVGLSTTRGLAHALHSNIRNGFEADYLTQFPDEIRRLTLDEVNAAIERHLSIDRLRTTIAGSLPERG